MIELSCEEVENTRNDDKKQSEHSNVNRYEN